MASQVKVGGYNAYIVNDDCYDYYLVKWVDLPTKATGDQVIDLDGEHYAVKEGEWYTTGTWFEFIETTTRW